MEEILRGYQVNQPTWFYLSALLIMAVFFKFSRLWSLRNLDLLLLLSLSPGLLIIQAAPDGSAFGYGWMFAATGLLLLRLFADSSFTRRPRLEQNLNAAGMTFLCCAAFLFQTTQIMTEEPHESTVATVRRADDLVKRQAAREEAPLEEPASEVTEPGPATSLLATTVLPLAGGVEVVGARLMAILAHAAVVIGLICIGRWHFSHTALGLAMATLYLLLPCTAYDVTRVNHLLPAALIVWAVAWYRNSVAAGVLLGLACGSMFFAIFLVPLWTAFYWGRGALRFAVALVATTAFVLASLMFTSADSFSFTRQIIGSIDWSVLKFQAGETGVGFWSMVDPAWRVPVFASFLVVLTALSIWPFQKSLEQLLSHSTAIIVSTQFWYPHQGGVYVLWYLPLMLLVVFRPRLAHLVPVEIPHPALAPAAEAPKPARLTLSVPNWRMMR